MIPARRIYLGFAVLIVAALVTGVLLEAYWLAAAPVLLLIAGQAVLNFRPFFWLLLICIPLGAEIFLTGGLSTDLPTEPLAVGLSLLLLVHASRHWISYPADRYLHPIAILLYGHVAWILLASCFAVDSLTSIKFSLAKLWYVGAFFLLPVLLLDRPARVTTFAHCICWPLLFVALQSLVRHAGYGFSFADQFRTLHPFMRNHVAYAGCIATFLPWFGYLVWRRAYRGLSWRWMAIGPGSLFLVAVVFSYTRAAYVALILAVIALVLIRKNLLRPALYASFAVAIAAAGYFVKDNRYLEYAPDYETTVSHREFDDLVSATYNLEDISTMERFYRWVAGGNMVPYRPVVGFGPGNFVDHYQGYTNNNFETYVSHNPERSGIHNYFLMTLVEQGYPGLILLLLFLGSILYFGQRLYLEQRDPGARAAVLAGVLSVVVVVSFSLINDLLETDKVGSLFFLSTAIIINMGRYRKPTGEIGSPGRG